jgi:hypothetical protein
LQDSRFTPNGSPSFWIGFSISARPLSRRHTVSGFKQTLGHLPWQGIQGAAQELRSPIDAVGAARAKPVSHDHFSLGKGRV